MTPALITAAELDKLDLAFWLGVAGMALGTVAIVVAVVALAAGWRR